eukprot:gene4698-9314_t
MLNRRLLYTPQYCEENVYHLARTILEAGNSGKHFVVFVTSCSKRTPIWCQRRGDDSRPVLWDYHVILVAKKKGVPSLIFDMDTSLMFPSLAQDYLISSIRYDIHLDREMEQFFKVIEAETFLMHFASDRSHMKEGNQWLASPPEWPCIWGALAESNHNLDEFLDLSFNSPTRGIILDKSSFYQWCEMDSEDMRTLCADEHLAKVLNMQEGLCLVDALLGLIKRFLPVCSSLMSMSYSPNLRLCIAGIPQ